MHFWTLTEKIKITRCTTEAWGCKFELLSSIFWLYQTIFSDYPALSLLSLTILDYYYLTLTWSIVYLGLFQCILLYLGFSWAILSFLELSRIILDYLWQSDKMTVVWWNDILTFTFYVIISKCIPNWETFEKLSFWFDV